MSDPGSGATLDRLVMHREFVHRLARSLVRESNAADDLEQEVWLTTLRSPPAREDGLRGWFRRVARSRAIDASRGAARRTTLAASATSAASKQTAPSAAELAGRLDAGRRVAAAVARLDEPYRQTILLRFYDDLEPHAIALRTSVPLETVRTRLRRAIERLREQLDRDAGGREAWMAAVLPLAGESSRLAASSGGTLATVPWGGGAVMGTKLTVAAVAAGAVIGSLVTVASVGASPQAPGPDPATANDLRALVQRVDAVETRVKQTASPRSDAPDRARDERLAALEARCADLEARSTAAAPAAPSAAPAPSASPQPPVPGEQATTVSEEEAAERLRRIVIDTSQSEAKRLEAFTKLRGMKSGFNFAVVVAARDLFRQTASAETRSNLLRDLHGVKQADLLPEVCGLFVAGLRDPDQSVRERAAEDADAFVSDPGVRQALEIVRNEDAAESVRTRAAKSLEPRESRTRR